MVAVRKCFDLCVVCILLGDLIYVDLVWVFSVYMFGGCVWLLVFDLLVVCVCGFVWLCIALRVALLSCFTGFFVVCFTGCFYFRLF